jgi:hypothetical protein
MIQRLKRLPRWAWAVAGVVVVVAYFQEEPKAGIPMPSPAAAVQSGKVSVPAPVPASKPSNVCTGGEAVLIAADQPITVARSASAYDQMVSALNARDRAGFDALIDRGQLLIVEKPTKALFLETGLGYGVVRFTSGPNTGEKVLVPSEFIQRQD